MSTAREPRGGTRLPSVASHVISGVGLLLALLWLWYVLAVDYAHLASPNVSRAGALGLKLVELFVVAGVSVGLVYAGYWFARSRFAVEQRWWAALWTVLGGVGIVAVILVMNAHQMVEGSFIRPALLAEELLLGGAGGCLAGLLIGLGTAESRRQAERVERQRDAFEFMNKLLRHNILNGITVVRGKAELLADDAPPERRAHLDAVRERCESMAEMTQNVRRMAHAVSGEGGTEPVDLGRLVQTEVERADRAFAAAEFRATVSDDVTVLANGALPLVVDNLLRNAVQHNDADRPRVAVEVDRRGDEARLRVEDNGRGIPPSERDSLFAPNDRGDSGFGLYLVDTVVSRLGGEVWVEDGDATGATFVLSLPAVASPSEP